MLAFLVGAAASAGAQVPVVYPRDTAASELGDQIPVWETHIAAGFNQVVAVFNQGFRSTGCRVGYAVYDRAEETWSQATVAGDHRSIDPSIAFDHPARLSIPGDGPLSPPPDKFVAAALNGDDGQILVSRYADGAFETWRTAVDWPEGYSVDKPWIVPGEVDSVHREYYIVYWHRPPPPEPGQDPPAWGYAYLRSTNSAEDWLPRCDDPNDNGMIKVNGEWVTGGFCAQPAVWGDGPLYIAYPTGSVFRFLRGDDRPDGGVNFSYLETTSGILELARNRSNIEDYLPEIPHDSVQVTAVVPQLAVDPGDPDRLYVVYNDTATAEGEGSTDVNIYLRVLTRSGGYWAADDRILVNNDQTFYESDQFRPAVTVDTQGYIHILFYDDRNYTDGLAGDQQPDGSADAKFDAFYAYAPLDDLDFDPEQHPERNQELYAVPPEAAVDSELDLWKGYELGEYNGITSFFGAGRHEVWTSFSGTKAGDPSPDKTVIYSSFIEW